LSLKKNERTQGSPTFPRGFNLVRWIVYVLIFLTGVELKSMVCILPIGHYMLMTQLFYFSFKKIDIQPPSLFRLS